MQSSKKWIVIAVLLVLMGAGGFWLATHKKPEVIPPPVEVQKDPFVKEIIGKSVENRDIEAYTYGKGEKNILFVGGMHGGYEWNSVLLAYQFKDYIDMNPGFVPPDMSITIIPSLNPDGLFKVVQKEGRFSPTDASTDKVVLASGRFNANGIDLNRNFGCKWQPTSTWQSKTVSAGTAAFSEPEAAALRDFVLKTTPDTVVFWHSQANAVYASECESGVLPATLNIMNEYADASGYKSVQSFDAYPVSGDAEGWLASIGIPAITVELSTHEGVEWDKNIAGVKAVVSNFGK